MRPRVLAEAEAELLSAMLYYEDRQEGLGQDFYQRLFAARDARVARRAAFAGGLFLIAISFFPALVGRLWCGFACPQTVWTEAFIWMEQWTEGTRSQRMKLDKAPWSWNKLRRKGSKQILWITFALWTGFTFVGYFTPIRQLAFDIVDLNVGGWTLFWGLFYGFATYGNAGFMREQVCKYMCPYARFQSAMFDKDTLIISYDEKRGEPRGGRKRSVDHKEAGLGDCIDCTMCVQVCPTGIDIRDGLQYQCITCSACIDACDDVMDKMGYDKGLIKYTTQNAIEGKPSHILRPRIVIYALILLTILSIFVYSFSQRTSLGLDVIRDRNRLYRETSEGLIENVYTLKILNMDDAAHEYELGVGGVPGIQLHVDSKTIRVEAGDVMELPVRLQADEADLEVRSSPITFSLMATDDPALAVEEEARFLGPQ